MTREKSKKDIGIRVFNYFDIGCTVPRSHDSNAAFRLSNEYGQRFAADSYYRNSGDWNDLCYRYGGIDLSVGGQVTIIGIISALCFSAGLSIPVVILIAVATGIAIGACNGLMISKLNFPPFMVTLAMQLVTYGIALYITSGRQFPIVAEGFDFFGLGKLGGGSDADLDICGGNRSSNPS